MAISVCRKESICLTCKPTFNAHVHLPQCRLLQANFQCSCASATMQAAEPLLAPGCLIIADNAGVFAEVCAASYPCVFPTLFEYVHFAQSQLCSHATHPFSPVQAVMCTHTRLASLLSCLLRTVCVLNLMVNEHGAGRCMYVRRNYNLPINQLTNSGQLIN